MTDDTTSSGGETVDAGGHTDTDAGTGSVFRSRSHRHRALAVSGVVCATVLLSTVVFWWLKPQTLDPVWLRVRLATLGPAAPLAFVCLQALQVVFAPIPGQVLAGVGGYLFGTWLGTLYSMVGAFLGSTVVFAASQRYGRPFVERALAPETLARFDGFVAEYGTAGLFVAFFLPTFPDDALCALAGLTQLDYRRFLLLLVVGRTPTFFAAAVAGNSAVSGDLVEAGIIIAGLAAASAVVYYFRGRLSSALAPLTDRGG